MTHNRLIGAVGAIAAMLLVAAPVSAAGPSVLVDYGTGGWRYQVVGHGDGSGFQEPSFDDSSWSVGTAAFGTTMPEVCPLNNTVATEWPLDTDILLRREVSIDLASEVGIGIAIDNDVTVYWDGELVGFFEHEFCADFDAFVVSLPNVSAGKHVLALRGLDRGGLSYLDARVTAQKLRDDCTIVGTQGDDRLVGTPGDDVICGGMGNDVLVGFGGSDLLRGDRGADTLMGLKGSDQLVGGRGRDLLIGGRATDLLDGGPGFDECYEALGGVTACEAGKF